MYLLDTNVVSELRRPRPHGAVVASTHTVPDSDLYVSAVTIGELQAGIELPYPQGAETPYQLDGTGLRCSIAVPLGMGARQELRS